MNLSSLLNTSEPGARRTVASNPAERSARIALCHPEKIESLQEGNTHHHRLKERLGELNDDRYSQPLSIQTKQSDASHTFSSTTLPSWGIRARATSSEDITGLGSEEERDDLRTGPRVPGHRFSDSQSSVQSCGSTFSNGHSRASSVTTVSETLTIPSLTDALSSTTKLDPVREETPSSDATETHSPSRILSGLTLQAGRASVITELTSRGMRPKSCSNAASTPTSSADQGARGQVSPRRQQLEAHPTSSIHKRASSAPILPPKAQPSSSGTPDSSVRLAMGNGDTQVATAGQTVTSEARLVPMATPINEQNSGKAELASPVSSGLSMSTPAQDPSAAGSPTVAGRRESLPSGAVGGDEGKEKPKDTISCMFIDRCDTGAQLRKAISHFFGRNKGCTLLIPNHIWVHYCRKHYQRVRYRNAKEYPVTQMDLVKSQVERLHLWSEENKSLGRGRVIKDWTFALRKREQQRLQEAIEAAASSNNTVTANAENGEPGTNVPQWVYDSLGDGYTTDQIMGLANRFYVELQNGTLEQIPEVEFLPNIIDDGKDASSKGTRTRKQTKRKATDADELPATTIIAESANRDHTTFVSAQTAAKRPRTEDGLGSRPSASPATTMPQAHYAARGPEVILPSMSRPQELSPLGDRGFESGRESATLPSFSQLEVTSSTPRSQSQFYSGSQPSTPRDPFLPWNGGVQSATGIGQGSGRPILAPTDSSAVQRWLDSDGVRRSSPDGENSTASAYQHASQHFQVSPHYAAHNQYNRHAAQHSVQSPRENSPGFSRPMLRPRHNTYSAQPSPIDHAHMAGHYIHGYAAAHAQVDHGMPSAAHQNGPSLVLSQPPASRHPLHVRNQSAPSRHANKLSPAGSSRFEYSSPYSQPVQPASGREASHVRSASLRTFSASGSTPRAIASPRAGARFGSTDGYETWRHPEYEGSDPKLAHH